MSTDRPRPIYKVLKLPLQHTMKEGVKTDFAKHIINQTVINAHKSSVLAYQFIKLYFLYCYKEGIVFPEIKNNKVFMRAVFGTINVRSKKTTGKNAELENSLQSFHDTHFQEPKMNYKGYNNIFDYEAIQYFTMLNNNIISQYGQCIDQFLYLKFPDTIEDEIKISRRSFRYNIKRELFGHKQTSEDAKILHKLLVPKVPLKKGIDVPLTYALKVSPQAFLKNIIYMNEVFESQDIKMFNMFPNRSALKPGHITLDTFTLVNLLVGTSTKAGVKSTSIVEGMTKTKLLGSFNKHKTEIWNFFFDMKKKCFKGNKGYSFHHLIKTDGVSVSLVFEKLVTTKSNETPETYITECSPEDKNKQVVAIDPGICDIIFAVDGDQKDATQFRYSQNQVRKESKSKKFSKITDDISKETVILGKTVKEHEIEFADDLSRSGINQKTINFEKYKGYVQKKNRFNDILYNFWCKPLYRTLKLKGWMNRKRSEQKMVNNFMSKFNIKHKDDVIICFGDFEQKEFMKFQQPVKGKGMRKLFQREGFKTYLVDEHKTSCMCSKCENGSRTEKFQWIKNPRPYRREKNPTVKVHGLIRCTSCCCVWNRDVNGSKNIYKVSIAAVNGKERPEYLQRTT